MSSKSFGPARCVRSTDVMPYLQNELDAPERAEFEQHLASCPACRHEKESFAGLLEELRAVPQEAPSRDLAPAVLARIHEPALPLVPLWLMRMAAVAMLAVLAGAAWLVMRPAPSAVAAREPATVARASLDWLCQAQQEDGQWSAERWGAQPMYAPGVTALALLALLRSDEHPFDGPYRAAIERGLDHLVALQKEDGRFGSLTSGTPYNHALSTLALLEGTRRRPREAWSRAAERGVDYVKSTQREPGGWGYPREAADKANTSITVWHLQVLLEARAAGLPVESQLDRGLAWLEQVVDESGHVGYARRGDFPYGRDTLTAAGALCMMMAGQTGAKADAPLSQVLAAATRAAEHPAAAPDRYRDYFLIRALAMAGTERAAPLAADIRQSLAAADAAPDRWSSAGGKVYETAMLALTLQSSR